jgi:hypothetical protein
MKCTFDQKGKPILPTHNNFSIVPAHQGQYADAGCSEEG